jgi:3-phenylpropionate/trans-cinnamate dioxygenase ferredoxin reductase component
MNHFDILIVGSGHAGSQAAICLRQLKYEGSIGVIGEEADLPYERPPLSKDYLSGEKSFDRILIRSEDYWAEQRIGMLLGRRVGELIPEQHIVRTVSGESFGYGNLIWAAGGVARRLDCDGANLAGIHYIRHVGDADGLLKELPGVRRIVVIGGGYVGLEAAASLRKMGKDVVLVEAAARTLARSTCETVSRFVEAQHRLHGVQIRLGVGVARIEGRSGRVASVHLLDGTSIDADLVVVGIGIVPAVEVLAAAGAKVTNGVEVDEQCRTSVPNVFAIGDCAFHKNRYADDAMVRLESVQNALDQAHVVARTLVAQAAGYDSLPWFWSNQYDIRLQTAGLSIGYDRTEIRGDISTSSFAVDYYKGDRLIATDCINSPKDFVAARKKLAEQFKETVDW